MSSKPLALITAFGGINSAGRSSAHLSYKNLVFRALKFKSKVRYLSNFKIFTKAEVVLKMCALRGKIPEQMPFKDRRTDIQRYRQTDRDTDRDTDRQTDRQTELIYYKDVDLLDNKNLPPIPN